MTPFLALAFAVVLWASAFIAIRAAVQVFPPEQVASLRFAIAAVTLVVVGGFARRRLPEMRDLPRLCAIGAVGIAAYNLALNTGAQTLSAAAASFLVNTVPVFSALLAWIVFHEPLRARVAAGIGLSMLGVALIAHAEDPGSLGTAVGSGAVLVLLAALCQAIYFVAQKSLTLKYSPIELTTYVFCAGALALSFWLVPAIASARHASTETVLIIVYLAIVPGVLGFVAYTTALKHLSVTQATTALFAVPVIALFMGWALLGERPTRLGVLGAALAIAGVATTARERSR